MRMPSRGAFAVLLSTSLFFACPPPSTPTTDPLPEPEAPVPRQVALEVSGLQGQGLRVRLSSGASSEELAIVSNGANTFVLALDDGASFAVEIVAQPSLPNQLCTLGAGAAGTVAGDAVLSLACETLRYTVGGTVSGLVGSGLILENQGTDALAITADGPFTFATTVPDLTMFDVRVAAGAQPAGPDQRCTVLSGQGNVNGGPVSDIQVSCALVHRSGVSVTGLAGGSFEVSNSIESQFVSQNGTTYFPTALESGVSLQLSVTSQPSSPRQTCVLTSSSMAVVSGGEVLFQFECFANSVTAMGALWFHWRENDGAGGDVWLSSGTACDSAAEGPRSHCFHTAERLRVPVWGVTSCDGLSAHDALGAFDWTCRAGTPVEMVSLGLKESAPVSLLIDFDTPAWKHNSVTVQSSSGVVLQTEPARWWSDTIAVRNAGGILQDGGLSVVTDMSTPAPNPYTFEQANTGLIVKPGIKLEVAGASAVVQNSQTAPFLWLEGDIECTAQQDGFAGSSANPPVFATFRFVNVSGDMDRGLEFGGQRNLLAQSRVEGAAIGGCNIGASLYLNHDGEVRDFTAVHCATGLGLYESLRNRAFNLKLINGGIGLDVAYAHDSVIIGVFAATNLFDGIHIEHSEGFFVGNATLAANERYGLFSFSSISNAYWNVASVANGGAGMYFSETSLSHIWNLASLADGLPIRFEAGSESNAFHGLLHVDEGAAGTPCWIDASITAPALVDDTCANAGTSDAQLQFGASVSNTFVGRVYADSKNLTDSNDGITTSWQGVDWLNFDNWFRIWVKEGDGEPAFPEGNKMTCVGESACRMFDFSLKSGDLGDPGATGEAGDDLPVLLGRLAQPSGSEASSHTFWSGVYSSQAGFGEAHCSALGATYFNDIVDNCIAKHLRNAIELPGGGNGNGLCQANEKCLHVRSIGAYQGRGALVFLGTTSGEVPGVELYAYEIAAE